VTNPLDPAVFPKVLANYAPMTSVYEALSQVVPPDLLDPDARTYVDRLAGDALDDVGRRMTAMYEDLDGRGLLHAFRNALARIELANNVLRDILGGRLNIDQDGRADPGAVHTVRARMEQFVDPKALEAILAARPRVCAVMVDGKIAGTGFLVGPDLVMTARHVVRNLLAASDADPPTDREVDGTAARLRCVFDYEGTLVKPFPLNPPPPGSTVVGVPQRWLVWSSHEHYKDGVGHQFDSPPDIRRRFDCAIIRLSKPVGEAATDETGSRIRGWIQFDEELDDFTEGQRLAMWQHPGEGPQVYGDGYYQRTAAGGTRIWYSAAADHGSSGAPCFDTKCRVVAFHNAGWPTQPEDGSDTKELNQGVPIRPLVSAMPDEVRARLEGRSESRSLLWSLGADGKDQHGNVHPVLGRSRLCKLIETMSAHAPTQRIIVVEEAAGQQDLKGTGKSFSARILRAMMRNRPGVTLVLSAPSLKDIHPDAFLRDLAQQLGILTDDLPPPQRPTEERQLTRWWSTDLPEWFGLLIEEGARREGVVREGSDGALGTEDEIVLTPTWIVLDDLHRATLGPPIRECLAGLIRVTETSLAPGLASLRWLLIGTIPDFMREMSYELDPLSPAEIGEDDWLECCRSAFEAEALGSSYDEPTARMVFEFAKASNPILNTVIETGVPNSAYLPTLAAAAALAIPGMLRRARG
jgi:hypothetical protein